MPPKDKYTDPELRDQVKEEVKESDKGGAPGQWSARKAQFMAQEYKKRGGEYNTDKKDQDESQKNLSKWSEEEWQTKEGSGNAKQDDGTQKRYLPKKAWENMSEEEKKQTDDKKQEESKEGKQFVGNTGKAKEAREEANKEESDKYEEKKAEEKKQDDDQDDAEEDDDDDGEEGDDDNNEDKSKAGQKRGRGKQTNGTNKKQKDNSGKGKQNGTIGSKHDSADEPAPRGSADRLPKKGQKVTWKAMPGWVEGEVVDIVYEEQDIEGKHVKASKEDPRIVLKSHGPSGKIAVHKPDGVFFE